MKKIIKLLVVMFLITFSIAFKPVTTKAIVMRFKYASKEEARKNYLKQIEYLKYGMCRTRT